MNTAILKELLNLIPELSEILLSMKWASDKEIIFETSVLKLVINKSPIIAPPTGDKDIESIKNVQKVEPKVEEKTLSVNSVVSDLRRY